MASIVLVFGYPGSGKNTLAANLDASYGFHRIEVDDRYVKFVEARYPQPLPVPLSRVILFHYDGGVVQLDDVTIDFGKGFRHSDARRDAWHAHLLAQIDDAAAKHPKIVVEGYLLYDCRTTFDQQLTAKRHRVYHIVADHSKYSEVVGPPLAIEEIAALGHEPSQT